MESRFRAASIAVVAAVLLSAPIARAQAQGESKAMDPKAHDLLVQGLTHFEAKEYEQAIREFRAGYAVDPRPELLFAIAQAERLSGDCLSAINAYERFLETGPGERQTEAATLAIERCRTALGAAGAKSAPDPEPARQPARQPAPAPIVPATAPPAAPDSDSLRTPWYKDKLGAGLLAAGVVTASVGLGYYVASSSDESAANEAATYGEYVDLMDRAEGRRKVAFVGLGVGAGLVTGAVVHYWLRDDKHNRGVALSATGDGGAVVYSANF